MGFGIKYLAAPSASATQAITPGVKPMQNYQNVLAATEAALAANAEFDSNQQICVRYGRLVGSVLSDQAGTLYIEQTQDGTNYDVSVSIAVAANTGVSFSEEVVAPGCRARYVNGATAQTVFRLVMNGRSV